MIIEMGKNGMVITNGDLAHRIADAEYYIGVALATGNTRNKRKWMKRKKELEELWEKEKASMGKERGEYEDTEV